MFPRWLGWIFLLFLGYVLYAGNFMGGAPPQAEQATQQSPRTYPKLATYADKEHWLQAINPDRISEPRWREITPGSGKGAVCGETLQVKITRGAQEELQQFNLGNAPYPVLNEALMHMQEGAVREVSAPADRFYKKPPKDTARMIHVTGERVEKNPPAKQLDHPK